LQQSTYDLKVVPFKNNHKRSSDTESAETQNSKTPGKVRLATHLILADAHTERELPLGEYFRAEKRILPLTCKLERLYLLE